VIDIADVFDNPDALPGPNVASIGLVVTVWRVESILKHSTWRKTSKIGPIAYVKIPFDNSIKKEKNIMKIRIRTQENHDLNFLSEYILFIIRQPH